MPIVKFLSVVLKRQGTGEGQKLLEVDIYRRDLLTINRTPNNVYSK